MSSLEARACDRHGNCAPQPQEGLLGAKGAELNVGSLPTWKKNMGAPKPGAPLPCTYATAATFPLAANS